MFKRSIIVACGMIFVGQAAHGAALIQDSFTFDGGPGSVTAYASGASISGKQPDTVNLPGGTYTVVHNAGHSGGGIDTAAANGKPAPAYASGPQDVVTVSLQSAGGYSKPSVLGISADIRMGSIGGGEAFRGIALGFNASGTPGVPDPGNGVNGVIFSPTGELRLLTNGNSSTLIAAYDASTLGAYSSSTIYSLAYSVDTVTGGITNLTLGNATGTVTIPSAGTTVGLTGAGTNFAAIQTSGNGAGQSSNVDNFTVVPEPGTLGLIGIGAVGLLGRRRQT